MTPQLELKEQCLADDLLGSKIDRSRPKVTAAQHPVIQRFLKEKELALSLIDGLGSPLNVMFPENIEETIQRFERVYNERQLQGRIFYTSKPNKSVALKKQAATTSVGLDVSSEGELKTALSCGFQPSRIEATGPKNIDYLTLAAQQDILINVDNYTELRQLAAMKSVLPQGRKVRILVRLDGFSSEASRIIDFLVANQDILDFVGFSFHFNAGDYSRRPGAIETCLRLTFECMERGLAPKALDIGGGYRIRYAADQDEWNAYIEELKSSVLGNRPSLTWNDSGLGFYREDNVLKGAPNFMEHFHKNDGHEDFASVIDAPLAGFDGYSAARILSENMLELYIEPGRALLDQCGITLARVNLTKRSIKGEQLVVLDMNRTNLNSTQLKLMTDPVVLYRNSNRSAASDGVMYVGSLCLTHDMIQYHKTFPQLLPQSGDVVAFINTAAYQMDFAETNVLQQRIAQKVAVIEGTDSKFRWFADELYNPLAIKMGTSHDF